MSSVDDATRPVSRMRKNFCIQSSPSRGQNPRNQTETLPYNVRKLSDDGNSESYLLRRLAHLAGSMVQISTNPPTPMMGCLQRGIRKEEGRGVTLKTSLIARFLQGEAILMPTASSPGTGWPGQDRSGKLRRARPRCAHGVVEGVDAGSTILSRCTSILNGISVSVNSDRNS